MRFYTIHVARRPWAPESALAEARAVKDGFSWPAFFFSFVWALWHRLWLVAAALIGLEFATGLVVDATGLDVLTETVASLGLALIVGWVANDLIRRDLERRGLAEAGVVMADSEEDAIKRYFTETRRDAPPASPAGSPA